MPSIKLAFHDTDTDILADILARIVARMSACRSACHRNNFNRACRTYVGENPREDVRVGVGVVEFQLNRVCSYAELAVSSITVAEVNDSTLCPIHGGMSRRPLTIW